MPAPEDDDGRSLWRWRRPCGDRTPGRWRAHGADASRPDRLRREVQLLHHSDHARHGRSRPLNRRVRRSRTRLRPATARSRSPVCTSGRMGATSRRRRRSRRSCATAARVECRRALSDQLARADGLHAGDRRSRASSPRLAPRTFICRCSTASDAMLARCDARTRLDGARARVDGIPRSHSTRVNRIRISSSDSRAKPMRISRRQRRPARSSAHAPACLSHIPIGRGPMRRHARRQVDGAVIRDRGRRSRHRSRDGGAFPTSRRGTIVAR